jgi:hypothetical protein
METVTMIVLVLYLTGSPIEFMGHHETANGWERMGIAGCLTMKRTLRRNGFKSNAAGTTRYSCESRKVKVGPNYEGKEIVKELL